VLCGRLCRVAGPSGREPLSIHVGVSSPAEWDETERLQRELGDDAAPALANRRRPALARPGIGWDNFGFVPRWIVDEATSCVAALNPDQFDGMTQYRRFVVAAKRRGETALAVAIVEAPRGHGSGSGFNIFDAYGSRGSSVPLVGHTGSIHAAMLGSGGQADIALGLDPHDKDLAMRIRNQADRVAWAALTLEDETSYPGGGWNSADGARRTPAQGHLEPLLISEVGEPLAAVWTSDDQTELLYVLPAGTPIETVLSWLAERGLPALVPGAVRRSLDPVLIRADFETSREARLRVDLADLTRRFEEQTAALQQQLTDEHARADPVRHALLFGTGLQLEDAVAQVLQDAGLQVQSVDELLGQTASADLLVTWGSRARLVEVKSSAKAASERSYDDLVSHLREWPSIGPVEVEGGALIFNHDLRTDPVDRPPGPYQREAFLQASEHPILGTIDILGMWLRQDWGALRSVIFGGEAVGAAPASRSSADGSTAPATAEPAPRRRRPFGRRA